LHGTSRKYEITVPEAIDHWGKNYPKVMTWLNKLQQKDQGAWHLWLYCKTVGKDPNELLALKDDPKSREAEYLLDNFVANEGFSNSVKVAVSIAVKSFFAHNYAELAKKSGQIQFIKQKPYRRHTKEELWKIYRAAQNPRDRSLISFTWSTAIARETLHKIQWKHLDADWLQVELPHIGLPDTIIKGHGIGKYKGVEQHTFLTPEAKRDLADYRDYLERVKGVKLTSESHIWVQLIAPYRQLDYNAFSKITEELKKRSGIEFSWHDARRFVETALEETKINPNWARKIRGRKVRGEEAPYSRPAVEQLRAAFKEAVPLLEFTQPTNLMEVQRRQEVLEKLQMKLMAGETLDPEDQANIRRFQIRFGKKVQGKYKLPKVDAAGAAIDNSILEEYDQIPEDQLLSRLKEGWMVAYKLASGEIIVKR